MWNVSSVTRASRTADLASVSCALRALVEERGQRDRGEDPDDQDHHHQLDQREAAIVARPVQSAPCHSPINGSIKAKTLAGVCRISLRSSARRRARARRRAPPRSPPRPSPRAGPRGRIRSVSPTTPIAPTAWPAWSKIGAATLDSPSTASSRSRASRSRARPRAPPGGRRGASVRLGELGQRLGGQVVEHARRARRRASPCRARSRAPAAARRPRGLEASRRGGRRGARRRPSGRA